MKDKYYLRMGSDAPDELEEHNTKRDAIASFEETARGLDRFGQSIEGSIHLAPSEDEVVEYPDFVLSLGPRGGVRCERT